MIQSESEYSFEQERQELFDAIRKSRALTQLKMSEGWEIVSDTLTELRNQAVDSLAGVEPGDDRRVLAGHAVFYAISATIDNLRSAVDNAIVRGEHDAPERLKEIDTILKTQQ